MTDFRHVLKKRLLAEDIITGLVDTFEGEKINLKKEVDKVQVEFTGASGATTTATVLKPSINVKNGIIHKIDTILLEPTTPTPTCPCGLAYKPCTRCFLALLPTAIWGIRRRAWQRDPKRR